MLKSACLVGVVLLLSACASNGDVDSADRNQFVVEFYATVDSLQKVKFRTHMGQAIAIGAATGAATQASENKESMFGGAIIGGIVGGVFSAIFEGSPDGYEYQLTAVDGDSVKVIVDNSPAQVGECVQVRVSGSVSLVKVDDSLCSPEQSAIYSEL